MSGGTYLYQINVTRDCNLRCSHCYIHSDAKRASGFMNFDNVIKIARDIREHMQKIDYAHAEIHLIGGEPTMLGKDFFDRVLPEVKAILTDAPFSHEVILVSNLLSRDIVPIAKHFDRLCTSYEPETRFPKPKLEQMWVDNVKLLQDNGIDVSCTTAMTKPVLAYGAANLLEKFMGMGIKQIHFGFFIPEGDGMENKDTVFPEFIDTSNFLIEAADWYFARRESHPDVWVNPVESMLSAIHHDEPLDDIVCPIIAGSMDINWDGNALTCLEEGGAKNPEWLGNVYENSITEVASSPQWLRRVAEAAKGHKACRTCPEFRICKTGCGVLARHWDPDVDEDCPGFRKFITYLRRHHEAGLRPRYAKYEGKENAPVHTQETPSHLVAAE